MRRRDWFVLLAGGAPTLDGAAARAFRDWFCWLAEAVYHLEESNRPAEITDCSSLARFAYREALRKHDSAWLRRWGFPPPPPLPEQPQMASPLFSIETGDTRHFADASNLMRYNTARVSREWNSAKPGDLLFFRQPQAESAYHMMIFLGVSRCENSPGPYVVYHTGPLEGGKGEMRRPLLAELLRHPDARWRPLAANPAFLGIYRWKLIAGGNQ